MIFPSIEAAWQQELPDKRLARRLQRLLDQLSGAPGKPDPGGLWRPGSGEGGLPLL
ncbi:hypothetical protein [Mesorhizobium sp. 43Arga]